MRTGVLNCDGRGSQCKAATEETELTVVEPALVGMAGQSRMGIGSVSRLAPSWRRTVPENLGEVMPSGDALSSTRGKSPSWVVEVPSGDAGAQVQLIMRRRCWPCPGAAWAGTSHAGYPQKWLEGNGRGICPS